VRIKRPDGSVVFFPAASNKAMVALARAICFSTAG
jgi:hypothetical protein